MAYDTELQRETEHRNRRSRRRRNLKRGRLLLMVIAVVLIVLDLILLLIALFKQGPSRESVLRIAAIYTWGAGIALVLHVTVTHLLYSRRDRTRAPKRKRRQEGAVLILVLVITAVITGLVLQVQWRARTSLARASALARHTRLQLAATDAARGALARVADDEDLMVDHLDEPWAAIEEYLDPAGVQCTVQVRDEQGFFNLNNLAMGLPGQQRPPETIFLDILAACGVGRPVDLVLALRDWVDEDLEGNAERSAYAASGDGQLPPNRPLATWSELLLVKRFDRQVFDRRERGPLEDPLRGDLVDAVTVLPPRSAGFTRVNVNTAGRDTLRGVLGLEYSGLVERLLKERASRPLRNLAALGLPPDVLAAAGAYLGVSSSYFRIAAIAEEGDDAVEVFALAARDDKGAVRLVHWVAR